MAIKAGTVSDFSNSMAQAMENAMAVEYQNLKGEAMPAMGEEDRRMLLCAIAQGVVRYLKDNLDAFELEAEVTQTSSPNITSGNGSVTVTQNSGSSNRARSSGSASITALDTTGVLHP